MKKLIPILFMTLSICAKAQTFDTLIGKYQSKKRSSDIWILNLSADSLSRSFVKQNECVTFMSICNAVKQGEGS